MYHSNSESYEQLVFFEDSVSSYEAQDLFVACESSNVHSSFQLSSAYTQFVACDDVRSAPSESSAARCHASSHVGQSSAKSTRAALDAERTRARNLKKSDALFKRIQSSKNNYEVLGLKPFASADEVKCEYRRLSMLVHPDKCVHEAAADTFKRLHAAYACLSDVDARKEYDIDLGREIEMQQLKALFTDRIPLSSSLWSAFGCTAPTPEESQSSMTKTEDTLVLDSPFGMQASGKRKYKPSGVPSPSIPLEFNLDDNKRTRGTPVDPNSFAAAPELISVDHYMETHMQLLKSLQLSMHANPVTPLQQRNDAPFINASFYQIEQIVGKRMQPDYTTEYRIKWKGMSEQYSSWMPENELSKDLISSYESTHSAG